MDPQKLNGQIALVTGADSGIGKGVAIAIAKAGAKVLINYVHNANAANEVVAEINTAGGEEFAYKADVSKEGEVQAMFAAIIQKYGALDILVNNAGLQKDSKFVDMTLDEWNTVININLTGQFLCSREAAKLFIKRGVVEGVSRAAGKIICMSSVHEIIPWAGHVNYAASKGGINMFMKSIAQELAPHKIRVVGIGPGAIQTPINKEAWETPEALNKLLTLIPYNRIGQPDDIGKLAVFLASDDADYITGTTIFADGGMTLYPGFDGNG
ncbi:MULTISPECIES: SDR family oxidoreductase [unclassified Mucilaginibacter]|uniref:SDR family oxidoreductase n=1 Tax=unclassified Mucilaginibacter TaxID=2617802 RepID=UPI002AC8B318|nr:MULTISPECIES: SDR family oxidoreductase [unclassified Mucilaginibacter]MEB0260733.1 SDR family oxidoreductase [Mucilaginibacter sp. 10I4]MEB0278947.1 SDR family oxidoreductase [Mucilaginibacter sp. 10B2]MEB0302860.1 SDR family oxidoreductase [Mucilaginibacter sp. 5C4]WPX22128.1 SDR family oxidoreductase [Mucilaginibacter sp. 5C4]